MTFFQLLAEPSPAAKQSWAAYQDLDRTQWLRPAELEELQLQRIRALLSHCVAQVPYYRRVLLESGVGDAGNISLDEFRRLPLLTRELYQTHFADLQVRALPPGLAAAQSVSYTSGTNGVPIKVLKTNLDHLWWTAFYLRDLEWSGIDPRGRLAAIRMLTKDREKLAAAMEGNSRPHWMNFAQTLLRTGISHGMDIRQDPRRQVQWLREIHPDYLLSMPSNLEFLASLLLESGGRIPDLRMIQSMGETLSPDARQRIEAGFGAPVKNLYSTTEAGYIASPCPSGNGLHVHSESVLAEVLDAENRPCKPGQTGRLVFTSLHNYITPFVRYEILDDVTLAPAPCSCGRGLPLWTHVIGRRMPNLHLPAGRRKSSLGIVLGLRQVGGVHQFQFVQRAVDHCIVRVVPDRMWNPSEHPTRMRQIVLDEFESLIRVDVEEKPVLERPAGGKLKLVIIELEERATNE